MNTMFSKRGLLTVAAVVACSLAPVDAETVVTTVVSSSTGVSVPKPKALKLPIPQHKDQQQQQTLDSVEKFSADVTTVLKELRGDRHDPTVPAMFHSEKRPTFAMTWSHEMWKGHVARTRFIPLFFYWFKSALLKRILPQLSVLMLWTGVAVYLTQNTGMKDIDIPMTSLGLVSGFVASLLGLRTNHGMSRLLEARQAFGKTVHYTRDMASLISNFLYSKDPQLALKLARHLSIFSWLLKNFVRGEAVNGSDEDLVRTMLPNPVDADYVLNQRKMPVAVVMRLRQALAHCTHKHLLSTAEEIAIDHTIQSMDLCIMVTERIVASPIPPLFTSHAGRLLTLYLFFLPIALQSSAGMDVKAVFITVFAVGYAMLGLDELSFLCEQPFMKNPLYHLCKNSMRDVADAFCVRPPPLNGHDSKKPLPPAPSAPMAYWEPSEELNGSGTKKVKQS